MGAVSGALADAGRRAGAEFVTGATVTAVTEGRHVHAVTTDGAEIDVSADHVVWAAAPEMLDRALGTRTADPAEGSQLKVNMVLRRLPRLRDERVAAETAFAGTLHVNEMRTQLAAAFAQAKGSALPSIPPCEVYCHTLSDRSILGPSLRQGATHTLTLFGLHMPARVFRDDPEGARERALEATLASLDSVLAEPIEDCLAADATGAPAIEVRHPLDLEAEIALPAGHIFHRDLSWPWADDDAAVGTWGVATDVPGVVLGGAGAVRGGGVSGIPGRAAAMAVLRR
jgi:phytoene dehydrogenase-like protein